MSEETLDHIEVVDALQAGRIPAVGHLQQEDERVTSLERPARPRHLAGQQHSLLVSHLGGDQPRSGCDGIAHEADRISVGVRSDECHRGPASRPMKTPIFQARS